MLCSLSIFHSYCVEDVVWEKLLLRRPFLADYSLTQRFAVEMPQQLDCTSCSDQLIDPVYHLPPSGDDLKELHKRVNYRAALLQMQRRHCKTCRTPLHADDSHAECVSCFGKSHAALSGADYSHCESFSLTSLRSQLAFFSEFFFRKRLRPSRPPVFFLPGTCEEKTVGQRIRAACDKQAHVSSMPAGLAVTVERAFTGPLHSA